MWTKFLLFSALFFFSCAKTGDGVPFQQRIFAQQDKKVQLQIFYEKTELSLSELWRLKLTFTYPAFYQFREKYLNFLDYQPLLLFTKPIETKIFHDKEDLWEQSFIYIFEAPIFGSFALQNKTFVLKNLATTEKVFLELPSIVLKFTTSITDQAQFQKIERKIKKKSYFIYYLSALVIFLLALIGCVFYQRKKPTQKTIIITKWALDELKKISYHKLITTEEIKNYHLELSRLLRVFFEKQLSIKALSQTRQEFLEQVVESKEFQLSYKKTLQHYLEMNDLVKFANYRSSQLNNKAIYELVERIIIYYHKQK